MDNAKPIYMGIDGGGSKTKAVVVSESNGVLGTGISGPGNPLQGLEQALSSVIESAQLALVDANMADCSLDQVIAGVGLAGVNLPIWFEKVNAWQHPFKAMHLTTDLRIACLGSHRGEDGAVIITGTGSCGYFTSGKRDFIVGGHGFPHGDKGSGAWYGFQAVHYVLLALDGLSKPTLLSERLFAKFKVLNAVELVEIVAGKPASFYATLANIVFDAAEEGDVIAINIVKEGSEYINKVAGRLLAAQPNRLSMIGGLSPRVFSYLSTEIQEQLSSSLCPPEVGAALYAKQQ